MLHKLRVHKENYPYFETGDRKHDIRKQEKDRKFKAFDAIVFCEWDPDNGYSGRFVRRTVNSVQTGGNLYGIPKGYCRLNF